MPRLFVAVDLPAELRDEVGRMMDGVHNARWANPRQLHVTLRFIGETPEAGLPTIGDGLAKIRQDGFDLRLQGVGVFPEPREQGQRNLRPGAVENAMRRVKVLWLGIEPAQELARLKARVDGALAIEATGEAREFSPHLTLARFGKPADSTLRQFLADHAGFASTAWAVREFHLYQSTLRRDGALHTRLASYSLEEAKRAE